MSVVLVHGAWHGGWVWDEVVRELAEREVACDAIELPFTGFADDVDAARRSIERAGPGAVVCGHSYGGFVISAAARGMDVGHLVYLCAFMVDADDDLRELSSRHPTTLQRAVTVADGRARVDPTLARECFYGDADPALVESILPRLRSIPAGGTPPERDPAWRTIESTYVVCTRDRAIHPDLQRIMARHATIVVEWDSDHSPFLTRPAAIASLLGDLDAPPRRR